MYCDFKFYVSCLTFKKFVFTAENLAHSNMLNKPHQSAFFKCI